MSQDEHRRPVTPTGESGATLILVMVLLLGVSVLTVSLTGITTDTIRSSASVTAQRTHDYLLEVAATTELNQVRYTSDPSACATLSFPVQPHLPRGYPRVEGQTVTATCIERAVQSGRQVTVGACVGNTCSVPSLTVVANVTDGPRCGQEGPGQTNQCGTALAITSWNLTGS
ncbi:MAG: hypothetical protein KGQ66_05470 [Acidobacteriota bacterium]|nr:hypothetical protein [Acidobacteriota bacterium]